MLLLQEWTAIADFLLAEGWERLHVSNNPDFRTAFSMCFAFSKFGSKSKAEEIQARLGGSPPHYFFNFFCSPKPAFV
jgi:hypothetical protein